MVVDLHGVPAVLLPGTGSDDDYVTRAFGPALRAAGAEPVAHVPVPDRLIQGYRAALDEAADAAGGQPIVVAGVSLGAAVAVQWAIDNPGRAAAVLAALPAWTGASAAAPAAATALATAAELRRDGLAVTTARMRESSPQWLADELTRSWAALWPGLPEAMEQAARFDAPSRAQLQMLQTPMGVVSATDDPIHPLEVGQEWVAAAPRAALRTVRLAQFGTDPGVLGVSCLAALEDAFSRR